MTWFKHPLLLALLVSLTARCALAGAIPEPEIRVQEQNDMLIVDIRYQLPVNQHVAWEVLTDFNGMAEFVPNMNNSRIVQRDGRRMVVEQKGKVNFGLLSFPYESKREIELTPPQKIRSQAISGTQMNSTTTLTPNAAGTLLIYRAEASPDLPVSNSMIASNLREMLEAQFKAMEQEMEVRARNAPPPISPPPISPSPVSPPPALTAVKPAAANQTVTAPRAMAAASKTPVRIKAPAAGQQKNGQVNGRL